MNMRFGVGVFEETAHFSAQVSYGVQLSSPVMQHRGGSMCECSDWTKSLWPAFYTGVFFFFESDEEFGGPTLKLHECPGYDDSHTDCVENPRVFEGTAYVTGEDTDSQAIAFTEALAARGPGVVVVPVLGPVRVHCESFKRRADRDKLGNIAFSIKFVRDGAASANTSVPRLRQAVFDAADGAAAALAGRFPAALTLPGADDCVVFAAVSLAQTVAASIELVRTTTVVDPDISIRVQGAEAAIIAAAPLLITPAGGADVDVTNLLVAAPPLDATYRDPTATFAAVITATIRLLGCGMAGNADSGVGALLELAQDYPPVALSSTVSANSKAAAANSAVFVDLARLAALVAWCEGLARRCYGSPLEGLDARAAVVERLSYELGHAAGAADMNVYLALQILQGATVQYLTRLIADLAPTATAPLAMPATRRAKWLGSPAVDLALRNETLHPASMTDLVPDTASIPAVARALVGDAESKDVISVTREVANGLSRGRAYSPAAAISLTPVSQPG
jgi:hypothetical protein